MPSDYSTARQHLERLLAQRPLEELERCLMPSEEDVSPRVVGPTRITLQALARRWNLLKIDGPAKAQLLDDPTLAQLDDYANHIENFIGTAKIPVGLAGPLRVRGLFAQGDFYVPLATTEAAMVASYTRGAQIISEAGGCTCAVLREGVSRAPGFAFANLAEAGKFVLWATQQWEQFKDEAQTTTQHGRLTDLRVNIEGNHVYLIFEYATADAAGQNMVTIATDAICRYILARSPIRPQYWFIEANMSGDKKASMQSFQGVRGRKVTTEVVLPSELVQRRLHCSVPAMLDYYHMSALGGVMSGTIGVQGHYANGLAALFIACGQDAACVAEAAVGITRFEATPEGNLYASVTLPNLIVGTVGGGTGLPSAKTCLAILGLAGAGNANAFAEVCAALALAGEISIAGALAADQFTHAHQRLARGRMHDNQPSGPGADPTAGA